MLFCVRIKKACFFVPFFMDGRKRQKRAAVKKYLKREKIFIKSLTKRMSGVTINIPVGGILSDINHKE